MRLAIRIVFLLAGLSPALAAAAGSPPLILGPVESALQQPEIRVLSQGEDHVTLSFHLPALGVERTRIDGQPFDIVTIPGGGSIGEPGAPEIPTYSRFVAIPGRGGFEMEVIVEEEEELPGYRLIPVQAESGPEFLYDAEAYSRDGFGELPMAQAADPGILREIRVVPLRFQPLRFNPAARVLRVARTMRVEVRFTDSASPNEKVLPARAIPASFADLGRALVVNYEQFAGDREVINGTYLLICPNNANVIAKLQPLVQWRNRKGSPVYLATTAETGTTNSSIKSFIQNAYDNWANPPEYICLVGDAGGTISLPTWYENLSGYNGEGDHPYVQLEGGDVLADAHIGRISVSTETELEAIVNKITGYESAPYMTDPSWFTRACLVGDPSQSGYSTVQVQQWIKVRLRELGYAQIDTIYASPFVSQMTTALNRGDTIFSYRGYYQMSGWSNSNTYALTNGWKMPFAVILTCGTGSFADESSCRSEGLLRANGGVNAPRGAIGAVGTATIGTHTRYNNCIHYGTFQGLLYDGATTLGAALTRGKLELYLNYQATEANIVLIWSYWNNLMGDPLVDCWTAEPKALTVEHPATISRGANSFVATVRRNAAPESNVQVCVWKGSETYAVGKTDANGRIELPISTPTTGSLLLTVTKHNRQPYQATIPVVDDNLYVGYQASTIDDDGAGESSGNGDGQINPGETIELRVQLKNFGTQTANGVTAVITEDDPYVTIVDGSETFGNIAAGATAWSADDFGISIGLGCPDGHRIRLGLDVTSGAETWHSLIELTAVAAAFSFNGTSLYNAGGNGIFDPGETIEMSVKLRNEGHATATGTSGSLVSLTPFVTVLDGSGSFGTIAAGANGENTTDRFSMSAAAETYQGYLATFQLTTQFSGGMRDTVVVAQTIGQRSSDDPIGPDLYGYYAFDNTDTSYPEAPVYSWVEIDPAYGGSGTEVPLTDFGTYQDDSEVINLPFPFTYYGTAYTKATICSNGWITMGSTYLANYRNWTIPAAGGPKGVIAGFWDDLRVGNGGKVLTYHDLANHRFIVEYSRVRNELGSTETFEIILHDPAFHQTGTGDGIILMQYNTVNNTDSGDNYATVGIEHPTEFDGLLYTFNNRYASGAATLQAGRAIRYLPIAESPMGTIAGLVTNASNGNAPLQGAEVAVLEAGRAFGTGADGRYGGSVAEGSYTVVARHWSFEPDTALGVVIEQGQATEVNFSLTDILGPAIEVVPHPSTSDTIGPYVVPVTLQDPSGVAQKSLHYRIYGETFTQVNLIAQGGDSYRGEIPGQAYVSRVEYYVRAVDNGGRESFDPPDAPGELYSFFVAPTVNLFEDDLEATLGWPVGTPDDDATSGIWERVDPNATYLDQTMVQPEDDHTPTPGVRCFITGQSAVGAGQGDNDVDGGKTTLTSPIMDLRSYGTAMLRYYRWYTNDTGNNPGQDVWVAQVTEDDGQTWVTIESTSVSDRSWKLVEVDLNGLIALTDQVRLRFLASDTGGGSVVEAGVDDVEVVLTGVVDAPEGAGERVVFSLMPGAPNPFRGEARIRFSLDRRDRVHLAIYDVQGRLVRRLLDESRGAGSHTVSWDGRDQAGSHAPAGIYFYRLAAESGRIEVRKLVRVE